jgi:hypothetical protein
MKINKINGEIVCPFCRTELFGFGYSCDTYGSERGILDDTLSEECDESEIHDTDNYEYWMTCCDEHITYSDAEEINEGNYECEDDEYFDDDDEDTDPFKPVDKKINPIKILLNNLK